MSPCLRAPLFFSVLSVATKRVSISGQRFDSSKRVRCREMCFINPLSSNGLSRHSTIRSSGHKPFAKITCLCSNGIWVAVWEQSCPTSITSINGTHISCWNCQFYRVYLHLSILNFSLMRYNHIWYKKYKDFDMKCMQMLWINFNYEVFLYI
jgi:hypothetical protein